MNEWPIVRIGTIYQPGPSKPKRIVIGFTDRGLPKTQTYCPENQRAQRVTVADKRMIQLYLQRARRRR